MTACRSGAWNDRALSRFCLRTPWVKRLIARVEIGSMVLAGHYQRCAAWFRSVLLLWIAGD